MERSGLAATWLFGMICFAGLAYAQTPPALSFFPHHQGDIWAYVDPGIPGFYEQNIITSDSVGSDGNYYMTTSFFGKLRLDTISFQVHGRRWAGAEYQNLIYRLDADLGQSWIVRRISGSTLVATVSAVSQWLVFGEVVTIKQIDFVDSASTLLLDTDYLASKFGLVGQDNDAMPYRRVRGAKLNGILYGTVTTEVAGRTGELPNSAILHQNYPNPFNPSTNFKFSIVNRELTILKVFDLLGREVATLVNEIKEPGTYEATWDASGMASGVYLYQLQAGPATRTRKLLLIK